MKFLWCPHQCRLLQRGAKVTKVKTVHVDDVGWNPSCLGYIVDYTTQLYRNYKHIL